MTKRALLPVAVLTLALIGASASLAGPRNRLTSSQWSTYLKSNGAFTEQTPKAVSRFRFCRQATAYNRDLDSFARCIGTALAKEARVSTGLFDTVRVFQKTVVGDCLKSLQTYAGALYVWRAQILGIQRAIKIHAASVATVEAQTQQAGTIAQKVTTDATAFVRDCKPRPA